MTFTSFHLSGIYLLNSWDYTHVRMNIVPYIYMQIFQGLITIVVITTYMSTYICI